jgi:hypothetical protein
MQPAGYSTYWQYTTALAFSVLAARNPAIIIRAANAIESFNSASSVSKVGHDSDVAIRVLMQVKPACLSSDALSADARRQKRLFGKRRCLISIKFGQKMSLT